MPHPLVVHLKKSPFDVYVGRKSRGAPPGTTGEWGNPFAMQNSSDAERDRVIREYEVWLLAQPPLVQKARTELKGKRLACWCAPKHCHADVLARIANEEEQQIETPKNNVILDTNEEAWPSLQAASNRK